eukprot:CAMPEP_0180556734 /NCGR_PEP_ID=MMETSP1037_2-20121125/764_1 /TAXON_ID=632150 /ORGANISM="Azadinium spinosum, Strain 3D9" /LENGTH=240 /DNA_ID=CAMNT_0022572845 /DNA_START=247 /DNA_END=966 /DNA_ORIENTATION=-
MTNPSTAECVSLRALKGTYYTEAAEKKSEMPGWELKHSLTKGRDHSDFWHKSGECIVSFAGANGEDDHPNAKNWQPVTWHGIPGVHAGLITELEPLIKQMDFPAMVSTCTKKFTVTGHSMGGGLAQLFALVLNKKADPLGAKRRVHELYTFGSMSPTQSNERNDQAANGCFPGAQLFNSYQYDDVVLVDVMNTESVGGHVHLLIKGDHSLLFSPDEGLTFPCGVDVPVGLEAFPTDIPEW